jgi:hypothetical protein
MKIIFRRHISITIILSTFNTLTPDYSEESKLEVKVSGFSSIIIISKKSSM